jgi:hypothetical protein
LEESFQGYCFGHAFFKAYQYAKIDNKMCKNLKEMSITFAHWLDVQKCMTWPKKSKKGKHEWNKTCIASSFHPRKLNIRYKNKVLFFQIIF